MRYVIKDDKERYVSREGSANSYTKSVINSRRWQTHEAAKKECCGNEHVVDLFSELEL